MNTTDPNITENSAPQTSPTQDQLPENIYEMLKLAANKLKESSKSDVSEVRAKVVYDSYGEKKIYYVATAIHHPMYFEESGSSPDQAVENVIKEIKRWNEGGPRPYIDGHGVLEQILESIARHDKRYLSAVGDINSFDDVNKFGLNCHLIVGHTNTHVGAITRLLYQRRFFVKEDREKLKDILRHVSFDL